LAISGKLLGESTPPTTRSVSQRARTAFHGDYATAPDLLEKLVITKSFGVRSIATPRIASLIWACCLLIGGTSPERSLLRKQAVQPAKHCGGEHPETPQTVSTWARLMTSYGGLRSSKASPRTQARTSAKEVLGEKHPETALRSPPLSQLLVSTGNYAAARSYHERPLAIRNEGVGESPSLHREFASIAWVATASHTGETRSGDSTTNRALAIRKGDVGRTKSRTAFLSTTGAC